MVAPHNRAVVLAAGLALAGLTAAATAGGAPDDGSPAPLGGLQTTYAGPVFAADGGTPHLRVAGLAPGGASSGTVTVSNPGAGSRWFWLGSGQPRDWVGSGGGRLSNDLALTVLDISHLSHPTVVYRGAASALGAQPLGFVDAGRHRTFSVTATLPDDPGLPSRSPGNPYAGSRLSIPISWNSLEASPAAPARPARRRATPPRTPADRTGPRVSVTVDRTRHPLDSGRLALAVRCSEVCTTTGTGAIAVGSQRFPARLTRSARGARSASMALPFSPTALGAVRSALTSGTPVRVAVTVTATDRNGNRSRDDHPVKLEPR